MCRFRPPFVEVIRCRKKLPPNLAISCRFAPTKVAGLFLFLPLLLNLDLPQAVTHAGLPGSEQIPPLQALLAFLAAKLLGKRRVSHISDLCCDEGAGLFAGLNVLPKATYATDYSTRPSGS